MREKRIFKIFLPGLLLALSVLNGCASNKPYHDPQDPYERYNRAVFKFNIAVDKKVYRPVARAYIKVVPAPINRRVTNFFSNIGDITHVGNDVLQGNLGLALSDTWRVIFNTTLGVGGLFDVATHLGLPKHTQDFGLTLAKWGYRNSAYFLVPFLGPGTVRDQFSSLIDYQYISVYPYIDPTTTRYGLYTLYLVDQRAALLPADNLIDSAFDPYVFVRNAYLQRRDYQIEQTINKHGAIGELDSESSGISSIGIN